MPFFQNSEAVSRRLWLVIPLGILTLMLAHWMALLFRYQPGVSLWFPPSGVAIALTFWFGSIGAMMTGIASIIMAPLWGHDGWSRLIGLTDVIEPLTAWFLYQRCCRGSILLNRLKDAAAFILSAPLAAGVTSALVGNLILLIMGNISHADIAQSISQWWLGNALGTMAIAPIALLLITPLLQHSGWLKHSSRVDAPIVQFSNFDRKVWLEIIAIAFFSISTAAITVSETNNAGFAFQQLSFLSFVPMIWAAIRFGVSGGMLTASFCVLSTLCAYLLKYPHAISLNLFPVSIEVLYVHKLSLLIQCGVTLLMGTAITEKTAFQVALAVEKVRTKEHQVQGQLTQQLTELNTSLGKTNTALEETLAMLDALLDSAPMGLSFRDRNLRCIRTNNSMAQMIGVSPGVSQGKTISEVSPRLGQILEPLMQGILDTGKPVLNFEINNEAIAPIGQARYWLCNYYPVHIDGEIIGIGGAIAEITELKRIETALRSSESRLRQIINSGMVGITFGDLSGNILECNQAFLNMLGYTQEDVLQENLRWDSLTPAEYTDIDEQAQARARLYEAEQAARSIAETANRIKDEFLTVLSHELRSPLNPILGWTKLLRTRKYDQAATDRALEIIERNAKLQTQLIDDLLDVSRILRGKLSLNTAPVSLQSVIEAAMDTMRLAAEAKSIEMQFYDQSSLAIIAGDPNRLQQVVWNLISNAIKFTDTGGKIEIYLSNEDGLADYNLTNDCPPKYAQIKVTDTGKGIKPEFLPDVFEHFRQADASITRKYGGLGLGLAIVRHLVEIHGGTVKADSKGEGEGAIFTVRLPLLNSPELNFLSVNSEAADLLPPPPSSPLANLRLLVVDDDPDSREFVSFVIEQAGAEIKAVASAGEALAVITQYQPDILVSDIGMPEEDGYSLIRKVRSIKPIKDILAIALTAYAREEDSQEALKAGFQIHISKPVEPEELVSAILNLTI